MLRFCHTVGTKLVLQVASKKQSKALRTPLFGQDHADFVAFVSCLGLGLGLCRLGLGLGRFRRSLDIAGRLRL